MRTQEEILERIKNRQDNDWFGWEWEEYVFALDDSHAKAFLKDGAEHKRRFTTDEDVRDKIIDYLPFAWEKANDQRGLSANRSIEHMIAWLWLLGDDCPETMEDQYVYYGKPLLAIISERFGVNWKELDDGIWFNGEYDGEGKPKNQVQPEWAMAHYKEEAVRLEAEWLEELGKGAEQTAKELDSQHTD